MQQVRFLLVTWEYQSKLYIEILHTGDTDVLTDADNIIDNQSGIFYFIFFYWGFNICFFWGDSKKK